MYAPGSLLIVAIVITLNFYGVDNGDLIFSCLHSKLISPLLLYLSRSPVGREAARKGQFIHTRTNLVLC